MRVIKAAALFALALYLFDQGMASEGWRAAMNLSAGVTAMMIATDGIVGRTIR